MSIWAWWASGRRIAGLLDALDLSDVTLVVNDTGGGIVLASLADSRLSWDRVTRLVFTNCDSFQLIRRARSPPSCDCAGSTQPLAGRRCGC
jgi:hypothetical protein